MVRASSLAFSAAILAASSVLAPAMAETMSFENAAAVLLNAVYFKAHWASTFSKSATTDAPFSLSATKIVAAANTT